MVPTPTAIAAPLTVEPDALTNAINTFMQSDPVLIIGIIVVALLLHELFPRATRVAWRIFKQLMMTGIAAYALFYLWNFFNEEAAKAGGYENVPVAMLALAAIGIGIGIMAVAQGIKQILSLTIRTGAEAVREVGASQAAERLRKRVSARAHAPAAARAPAPAAARAPQREEYGEVGIEEKIASKVAAKLKKPEEEKSLLSLLVYMVVAQFGVFSKAAIAAPDPFTGFAFFVLFVGGAALYMRRSYRDFTVGLKHLAYVLVAGFVLSVLLAIYWINLPAAQLLSFNYFKTGALVALVTSVAVTLVLGGKG